MIMIAYDDPIWKTLCGGYQTRYDPTEVLRDLESGKRDRSELWEECFRNLHHQGRVGTASYAVVPELSRIGPSCAIRDWEFFALVATIEDCRVNGRNAALPAWLETTYMKAIQHLARYGASVLAEPVSKEQAQGILALSALANGLQAYGNILIDFTNDEIREMIELYRNAE